MFGCNQYGQLVCNNCKLCDVLVIVKVLEEKIILVRCQMNGFEFRLMDVFIGGGGFVIKGKFGLFYFKKSFYIILQIYFLVEVYY